MLSSFHIYTRPTSQPDRRSPLGVFGFSLGLPYTPPNRLSFLKSLNQNLTLRSIPVFLFFFWEDVSCIHSKNETWSRCCCVLCLGFTNMASEMWHQRRSCLEAYCLYSVLALRCKDSLSWLLSNFVLIRLRIGNIQRSVLPSSYSSNPGCYQQCYIM